MQPGVPRVGDPPYVVSACHSQFWKAYFGAWNEECRGIFRLWCRGWDGGWNQSLCKCNGVYLYIM